MKPNVLIINTAKGAIINTRDIIEVLRNEYISGLAIDVSEPRKNCFFKTVLMTYLEMIYL